MTDTSRTTITLSNPTNKRSEAMVVAKIKTVKKWYQKNTTVSFRFIGTTEVTVADYVKEFERVSGKRGF